MRGAEPDLLDAHDALLVDLDGVVVRGEEALPHAVQALAVARQRGVALAYVTNNASRPPAAVAAHLTRVGVPAAAADVVTSAQAAAGRLGRELPEGAPVLVVGGAGVVEALRAVGLTPVRSAQEAPVAVVQGFAPEVDWRQLAEACYALASGARWVATNTDLTLPTGRGPAPGNGALVLALQQATGRIPEVAGKPGPALFAEAVRRLGCRRPLVVGDRLDTDIAGARAAALPSLLVLTGVSSRADAAAAPAGSRPTYIAEDLRGLLGSPAALALEVQLWA